jgi:MFS family permease
MPETYAPTLLAKKTRRLRKATGNPNLHSALETHLPMSTLLRHSLSRPMKLLLFSPVVLGLSTFMAFCFGCLYLIFTTFTMVYEEVYGWDIGMGGLSFLGMGVGSFIEMLIFGGLSDRILEYKAAHSPDGELKPEYRLILLIPAGFFIPIGLFWYGWAAEAHTHWIVPILGTVWIGMGFLACMVTITSYLMDAYTEFSASAVASCAVLRSIFGGLLPLAGRQMYATMGYGWGSSLLGFVSILLLPCPIIFYLWGERLRKRFPVNLK